MNIADKVKQRGLPENNDQRDFELETGIEAAMTDKSSELPDTFGLLVVFNEVNELLRNADLHIEERIPIEQAVWKLWRTFHNARPEPQEAADWETWIHEHIHDLPDLEVCVVREDDLRARLASLGTANLATISSSLAVPSVPCSELEALRSFLARVDGANERVVSLTDIRRLIAKHGGA